MFLLAAQTHAAAPVGTRVAGTCWRSISHVHFLALAPPRPTTTIGLVEQTASQSDACDDVRCSGHSYCYEGACHCAPGFQPPDCVVDVCFGHINGSNRGCHAAALPAPHGTCVEGACVCEPGWAGDDCSQDTCPGQCPGRRLQRARRVPERRLPLRRDLGWRRVRNRRVSARVRHPRRLRPLRDVRLCRRVDARDVRGAALSERLLRAWAVRGGLLPARGRVARPRLRVRRMPLSDRGRVVLRPWHV